MDYYTALRKAGLGQYVPNQFKQRRSIPRSNHREMHPRYAQSQVKEWERYQQSVWPEMRGHSSQKTYYSPALHRARDATMWALVDHAESILEHAYRDVTGTLEADNMNSKQQQPRHPKTGRYITQAHADTLQPLEERIRKKWSAPQRTIPHDLTSDTCCVIN